MIGAKIVSPKARLLGIMIKAPPITSNTLITFKIPEENNTPINTPGSPVIGGCATKLKKKFNPPNKNKAPTRIEGNKSSTFFICSFLVMVKIIIFN